MTARTRLLGSGLAATLAVLLGVVAAWPIYQSTLLLIPAAAGLLLGFGIAVLGARRLSVPAAIALLVGAFALTVVPVAVPSSLVRDPLVWVTGLREGLAAAVLGWKQLLTLTLPVGSYQTVLVPAYVIFLVTSFLTVTVALRAGRFAPLAAFPLLLPVAFGTVFGASTVSEPLLLGALVIEAPREIALWGAALLLGMLWVWFSAGASRRAALRLGRRGSTEQRHAGRGVRPVLAGVTVLAVILVGLLLAPVLDSGARHVPRDRIDPEIVLRERPSPLASYRTWKHDEAFDAPLFIVSAEGALPARLRLAVLESYDGVDFHVGTDAASRFTRFPSAPSRVDSSRVTLSFTDDYSDIWVPTAELSSVPSFTGPRAADLADAFFVSRDTGAAIVAPGGSTATGLGSGDGLQALMSEGEALALDAAPAQSASRLDLSAMPELASWLAAQDQPATAEGLIELVQRLRDRGYLSHSISDGDGQRLWSQRLAERYGARFEASTGGHSIARLEQLFSQLNAQQRFAPDGADDEALIAAIGDDEQFAAAAALIARALGFESRIVIGVRLGGDDAGVPGVPACEAECTGEHIAAWIEVRGERGGWVPVDVTPQLEHRPSVLEAGEQLPRFATTPEEREAREIDPPLGVGERSDTANQAENQAESATIWPVLRGAALLVAALALIALPLLFLPLAKRLRSRRRRRARDPELRVLGGWQELVDRSVDAGERLPASASRSEIALRLNNPTMRWAAETADRAVFSAAGASARDAEWVWAAVEADRLARRERIGFWRRLRAAYSLRSYGVRIVKRGRRAQESAATARFASRSEGDM